MVVAPVVVKEEGLVLQDLDLQDAAIAPLCRVLVVNLLLLGLVRNGVRSHGRRNAPRLTSQEVLH